jgi:sugar diacid utilization regulator
LLHAAKDPPGPRPQTSRRAAGGRVAAYRGVPAAQAPENVRTEPEPKDPVGGGNAAIEPPLVAHLRGLHLEMMEAVLHGEGLERVAELTAEHAGGPVAIIIPRVGTAVAAPAPATARLAALTRYVVARLRDRPAKVPEELEMEVPIGTSGDPVGAVLLLRGPSEAPRPEAGELLHLASVASLTELALVDTREQVEQSVRGSLLEELRTSTELDGPDVARRAARLGCDVARGAIVLCAHLDSERPGHVVATIAEDAPGSLAQVLDGRLYALLPVTDSEDAALETARRIAARLRRHGTVGVSSVYKDPAEFHRAVQEAELVLEVLRQSGEPLDEDIGGGTYRLLFRVLASHPGEVQALYRETVEPIVRYDDQYSTDLVATLEAYLGHNCNMNATAAAIYAHRHTVAYRLERISELTGLDPLRTEDRERLGLGLKAYRIIAPRLHR